MAEEKKETSKHPIIDGMDLVNSKKEEPKKEVKEDLGEILKLANSMQKVKTGSNVISSYLQKEGFSITEGIFCLELIKTNLIASLVTNVIPKDRKDKVG